MYLTMIGAEICGMSLSGPIFASCNRLARSGGRKLLVSGEQIRNAAREPLFTGIN
jgi:hypothetical protein